MPSRKKIQALKGWVKIGLEHGSTELISCHLSGTHRAQLESSWKCFVLVQNGKKHEKLWSEKIPITPAFKFIENTMQCR